MTNEFDHIAVKRRLDESNSRYMAALTDYRRTSSRIIVMMTVAAVVLAALAAALVRADSHYALQDKINQERTVKW